VYGFLYLICTFPEQSLVSELDTEPRSVVSDEEVVQSIEAFVFDFCITELLSEMFQDCASRFLNFRYAGIHLLSPKSFRDYGFPAGIVSENRSSNRICHQLSAQGLQEGLAGHSAYTDCDM